MKVRIDKDSIEELIRPVSIVTNTLTKVKGPNRIPNPCLAAAYGRKKEIHLDHIEQPELNLIITRQSIAEIQAQYTEGCLFSAFIPSLQEALFERRKLKRHKSEYPLLQLVPETGNAILFSTSTLEGSDKELFDQRVINALFHEMGHYLVYYHFNFQQAYAIPESRDRIFPLGLHCIDEECIMYPIAGISEQEVKGMQLGFRDKLDPGTQDEIYDYFSIYPPDTEAKSLDQLTTKYCEDCQRKIIRDISAIK